MHAHLERSVNARRLQALSEKLSRYLAPQVYKSLFDGSRDAEIRTSARSSPSSFGHQGFHRLHVQVAARRHHFLLNSYSRRCRRSRSSRRHAGQVHRRCHGDLFGDPDTFGVKEDALRGVKMALAMQRRMAELQILWREMGSTRPSRCAWGINTGYCDVGNFGSDLRMDYTIIGSEVNWPLAWSSRRNRAAS